MNEKKTIEYREIKPHWNVRLKDKEGNFIKYDYVMFVNGYQKNSIRVCVEHVRTEYIETENDLNLEKCYGIYLGKILFNDRGRYKI